MSQSVVVGLFSLAGVLLGFVGTLCVEWLRDKNAHRRMVADRKDRFDLETLTEFQDELAHTLETTLDEHHARKALRVDGGNRQAMVQLAAASETKARMAARLLVLASRLQNERVSQAILALTAMMKRKEELEAKSEELAETSMLATVELYAMIQGDIGRMLRATVEGRTTKNHKNKGSEDNSHGRARSEQQSDIGVPPA